MVVAMGNADLAVDCSKQDNHIWIIELMWAPLVIRQRRSQYSPLNSIPCATYWETCDAGLGYDDLSLSQREENH